MSTDEMFKELEELKYDLAEGFYVCEKAINKIVALQAALKQEVENNVKS